MPDHRAAHVAHLPLHNRPGTRTYACANGAASQASSVRCPSLKWLSIASAFDSRTPTLTGTPSPAALTVAGRTVKRAV